MTVSQGDIRCRASSRTRRLIKDLFRRGVIRAHGCVVLSRKGMGEPPAGLEQVLFQVNPGFPPLNNHDQLSLQSAMADEMMIVINRMMPPECGQASFAIAEYSVSPATGVASLFLQTHGIVDHQVNIVIY